MGLKAMAEAALQQCAPRTIERTLPAVAPAHSPLENETVRTLSDGDKSALAIAESAIAKAALTPSPATRRCIECEFFARVGVTGERCSHPDRSPPGEPARADCLPAHQCERFIHWRTTGAFNAVTESPSNSSSKETP